MSDDEPGEASTILTGLALARHLARLPAADLPAALCSMPATATRSLAPFLPEDCDCPITFACAAHPAEPCDCPTTAEPCPHIRAAQAGEWPLPPDAVAWLLALRSPRDYLPPPLPPTYSRNTSPRAQVAVMALRHRRRQHLRHPLDWICLGGELDERLTRRLRRIRNGTDAPGPLMKEDSR